jgi:hypothetical protein
MATTDQQVHVEIGGREFSFTRFPSGVDYQIEASAIRTAGIMECIRSLESISADALKSQGPENAPGIDLFTKFDRGQSFPWDDSFCGASFHIGDRAPNEPYVAEFTINTAMEAPNRTLSEAISSTLRGTGFTLYTSSAESTDPEV